MSQNDFGTFWKRLGHEEQRMDPERTMETDLERLKCIVNLNPKTKLVMSLTAPKLLESFTAKQFNDPI